MYVHLLGKSVELVTQQSDILKIYIDDVTQLYTCFWILCDS